MRYNNYIIHTFKKKCYEAYFLITVNFAFISVNLSTAFLHICFGHLKFCKIKNYRKFNNQTSGQMSLQMFIHRETGIKSYNNKHSYF